VTAQGSPRSIFKRAIERGNVVVAEATAREFALTLEEAFQLILLYAAYEPAKLEQAALAWFRR
jgi:FlaA1/EpsC-like NDP-sugar epimerase